MKRHLSLGALVGALVLSLIPAASAHAATSITTELGGWVPAGESAAFSVALSGTTGEDLVVSIELADGTMSVDDSGLALTLQTGSVSFTDVSQISFTGSSADVTTALADRLTWTAPLTPEQSYLRLSASVGSYYEGLIVGATNDRYYLLSTEALSWPGARDAAADLNYNGLTGYLATITSGEENTFVASQTDGVTVYFAATSEIAYVNPLLPPEEQYEGEAELRGTYHWGAGPEAGEQVAYTNWFPDEPNNQQFERCLLTNWNGSAGFWNDGACASSSRYLVEVRGLGNETGPAEFDNLAAGPPPLPEPDNEPELAATGVDAMVGVSAGALTLLVGLGMLVGTTRLRARRALG